MEQRIRSVFDLQQAEKLLLRKTGAKDRIVKLKKLRTTIAKNEKTIYKALQSDLRKSEFEAAFTEVFFSYAEIDYAIKNLKAWLSPKRIGKTLSNPFAKNRIIYEPKGICLIISPWNYPFQLMMGPLVSAIAAGNCVILKPSELSPATSSIIAQIVKDVFEENEIACFEGDASISTALLKLPFDHIFFTGSTDIGKVVMQAAAKNLTSVTLELGGKSPTIIDSSANLQKAAEKIAWGKLINAGQTCIAPDYLFLPENNVDEFIGLYKNAAKKMYFKSKDKIDEKTFGKIISERHYERLKLLVNEAVDKGARIDFGGTFDDKKQTIYPVVLSKIPNRTKVMEEEIFGPILPIIAYQNLDEVVEQINAKSKPLAMYIFSDSRKNIDYLIRSTSAGGTCVNDVLVHISNPKLPFGGVNGSGIGASHGFFGFKNFSHERAIVYQSKIDFNHMAYPPYDNKNWVLNLLRKIM